MTSILRWIGIVIAVIIAALVLTALFARVSDGPIGIFAGGPLTSGEYIDEEFSDWSAYEGVPEIDMQLLEPPRSRRVWTIVDEGNLYIPAGWVRSMPLWKQWPHEAVADGRAIVRIQGRIYPVELVKIEDSDLRWKLFRKLAEKYELQVPDAPPDPEDTWIFRAEPRASLSAGDEQSHGPPPHE